uniref:Tubulin/FtsZ 2-layer sandwich domain-containing protein n=1 Tax=Homalodisca liturata TaxID=320908 RepID=A0A1B6IC36_9HEMI
MRCVSAALSRWRYWSRVGHGHRKTAGGPIPSCRQVRFVTCVHPGQYNDVITSPYNIALSLRCLSEYASCVIPVDNKALGDICERHQLNKGTKPFQDVNNVIVSMLLNLTSGSRFSGSLNYDLSDLSSLVPRPSLHYLSASLSPLDLNLSRDVSFVNKKRNLLQEVCAREDQLLRVNALGGQLLSAALLCRGQVPLSTLRQYVTRFQSKVKYASWSDPGVKTGLCSVPPVGHNSAMLCLVNSTNMANFFNDSLHHFNLLYKRKAHVHHYTNVDGFDSDDFLLTRESLMTSAMKYSEAANFVEIPRLKVR